MEFAALVENARTCRRFVEDERLSADDAAWLVNCARLCPSTKNAQVLRYITVTSPEKCAELFPHLRWALLLKGKGTPVAGERPTAYIAMLTPPDATTYMHYDIGIAAQTMQLAARSKGWGCCMHSAFDPEPSQMVLSIPQNMNLALILAIGKAKEICKVAPMSPDGSCAYWRDEHQVHHVPKRSLNDCLLTQL